MSVKEGQRRFKVRKTPSSEHPSVPPRIESSIDVIYHAIKEKILEDFSAPYRDLLVTTRTYYKPGLLAIARVTFETSRWDLYHEREVVRGVPFPPPGKTANWEENLIPSWDHACTRLNPEPECFYLYDNTYDFSSSRFERLQEEYIQHLISNEVLKLQYNPELKLYKKIDESDESFFVRCLEKIRASREQEMRTLEDTIQRQIGRLKEKLDREVREIGADQLEIRPSKNAKPHLKKTSSAHSQEMDLQESIMTIDDINKELVELERTREMKKQQFEDTLTDLAYQRENDLMRLNRGDIQVMRFSLIWLPYTEFVIQEPDHRRMELIQSF